MSEEKMWGIWEMREESSKGEKLWTTEKYWDEKVNAHLPYYSTLKKFWNGFFQTFQAGLLFFSSLVLDLSIFG